MTADTDSLEKVPKTRWEKLEKFIEKEATFYRIHLISFTFIPLICSGIFYGCNGRFHISFVDSLFLCYSAMTVTGLSTINLSTTTVWQQVMLYLLMCIGDITFVSWMMVLVRRSYFRSHCEYAIIKHKKRFPDRGAILASISAPVRGFRPAETAPVNGRFTEETPHVSVTSPTPGGTMDNYHTGLTPAEEFALSESPEAMEFRSLPPESPHEGILLSPIDSHPSTRNIHFASGIDNDMLSPTITRRRSRRPTLRESVPYPRRTMTIISASGSKHHTMMPNNDDRYKGLGGFPGPIEIFRRLFKRVSPRTYRNLHRKLTLPYMETIEHDQVSWLSFNLNVGRNSNFRVDDLTDEEIEEVGGVEYRALNVLMWLVPLYFVGFQLVSFVMIAPWISTTSRYDSVFDAQARLVSKPWFTLFQVMGAYTGGGLSLVDEGMLPFQNAWLMIVALIIAILAGNHALPIFMRFTIWIGSRVTTFGSDFEQAFSFLLKHPRRCYIYLFPSHQTWFLVICLVVFSAIEWIFFEILNIGLEDYNLLSAAEKTIDALFQGLAARASGFSIVPLASLAPSLQFLYVVMMYIAVYPIAFSIRASNVYEERSLGVFEEPPDEEDEEPQDLDAINSRRQRVGRYLAWHVRRQVSTDIWWLVWGVFLVAIIERTNLMDDNKKWFDVFRVLFELVSAFGGIGLSLGFPDDNYSFVGTFSTLSKLVVIVIMVRGRHRGLPVAVDRAVLLPNELRVQKENEKLREVSGTSLTSPADTTATSNGNLYSGNPFLSPVNIHSR